MLLLEGTSIYSANDPAGHMNLSRKYLSICIGLKGILSSYICHEERAIWTPQFHGIYKQGRLKVWPKPRLRRKIGRAGECHSFQRLPHALSHCRQTVADCCIVG
ncbi:uncharacterized protein BO96DRAFT_437448 [Aspergillus niger CBS 101883]|uniref:Uncharacterized protein n=2 Tax=Aspergillus niger TaxID=5061 RepID=A2QHL4_ASPNC|nr:uncharacterized protein BO96DRAFT_437448 [Aspergillus niger CBS 101883]XP_059600418.1 hypothetical protein An04g00290 [Aspergillus niger]PYH53154.1 hypothetical protein BO96DRAFT_437448 [Aspergillus niger CBS 101883]CAK38484.1 hypothetical protein An04g00290 [Aspergillus niger]